jgi:cytochrome b involved in lipid metabolism
MTRYEDALEEFNRASHPDALCEMQLTPYIDPVRPTPASTIRSMETRDLFVSLATAALLVIVIPFGLLVLSVL